MSHSWEKSIKKYGLTVAQFNKLSENGCHICGGTETSVTTNRLFIDHDHNTGKVRGLLCQGCNATLGAFKDDIQLMEKAIEYLTSQENG